MCKFEQRAEKSISYVEIFTNAFICLLVSRLQTSFESNIRLYSPSGDEYRLHKFVLSVRCPKLLQAGVTIPASRGVCKQLFDYIYGQQCDLSNLKARELVQLIQTLQVRTREREGVMSECCVFFGGFLFPSQPNSSVAGVRTPSGTTGHQSGAHVCAAHLER